MINPEETPLFPTDSEKINIEIPKNELKVGDFLVSRYVSSAWARYLPWEEWHHAALISQIEPLKIIEAVGENAAGQFSGPAEVDFQDSVGFGLATGIREVKWLRPIFSGTIREMAPSNIPRKKRQVITEDEARKRAVEYARQQLGEPYSLLATKWSEDKWYCSLLVYKSYSRTVTGMYLEDYDDLRAGFFVTPEDLIDSPRSKVYFTWKYGSYHV